MTTIPMRRALLIAACAAARLGAVAAQPSAPQQPQATFKSGVDVVHVDVSVLDKDRRPVRGLSTADFVVREDGKVRPVVAFSEVELPSRPGEPPAAWMRDVPADVVTNQLPRDGRLVVILIDRTIRPEDMPAARRTAEAAVDEMGPGDLAAVIFTTHTLPQNFTADRSILRAAINRTFVGLADDGEEAQRGECKCGVCTLEAMTIVADALRDVPERRKMLLFIGASVPVVTTAIECAFEVREAREKLLRAAGVANLAIHSVDSNLLETLAPSAQERNAPADRSAFVLGHLKRQGDLGVYPGHTGGRAIQNTNAPQESMPAVFAESQSYYVLGFTPTSPNADGRYHDIKVEIKRRGVSVHPRRGYYAPSVEAAAKPVPPNEPPPSLVKALAGFWPSTGLPLVVSAAAFADPGNPEASVAIVVRARERTAIGETGKPGKGDPAGPMRVGVLAGAYDRDGRSIASHVQTLRVLPPPGSPQEFEYEALSRLRLKPGRHEVRVAVEDPSRNASGSVYTYVEVPDFAKAAVSLSGVVLSTKGPLAGSPLTDLLPVTPTARRQFRSTDEVRAFVRVYQGGKDAARPVIVAARILNTANARAFEHQETLFEQSEAATRSADYRLDLPLSALPPGPYLLTIEATRATKETARRDVRFEIVDRAGTTLTPDPMPAPAISSVLRASGAYLAQYERDVSGIVAEEDYMQRVPAESGGRRRLRSDMLVILDQAAGWLGFRDVFEVDGRPVRDRDERLARLFMKPNPNAIAQAKRIGEESSRFNLNPSGGGVIRTINQPLIALKFLRAANQARSDFKIDRMRTSAGRTEVLLTFAEKAKPRLIASPDNAAASGSFWIDSTTGRISASELIIQTGSTRITIRVTFGEQPKLRLWLPITMEETYTTRPGIEGRATYSNFRQFKVETDTTMK
jgi:VWFA-related protein